MARRRSSAFVRQSTSPNSRQLSLVKRTQQGSAGASTFAEGCSRLVDPLLDRRHALAGTLLTAEQLAQFRRNDVVRDLDPGRQLGLGSHGVVDGPFGRRKVPRGTF